MQLHVEIPASHVKAEVDKAYLALAQRSHIKGFRPGKAPRAVLSRLYDVQVKTDVANAIVNDTLPKVLNEKNLTPVTQPAVETDKGLEPKEAFSYRATFEVQPEIENVVYEGFELFQPKVVVEDDAIEQQLEALRRRHASLSVPSPTRSAQKGDMATIDFVLSVDDKEIAEGGGQGVQIEVGAGQALPEIDEALLGKEAGSRFTVTHAFAENHAREEFRGRSGVFSITLAEIKEHVLPAIDDEFAKDIGFDTLVALRADIHTKLERAAKNRSETVVAEQIVKKLSESNPCDVPPSLVDQQSRLMEQEVLLAARRAGQSITKEQYQRLKEALRPDAELKVRAGLLMAAIAKQQEFRVTDADLERGLAELAEETGKNVAKLRVEYREKNKRDVLVGMVLEEKILDFIATKSKITEGEVPEAPAPAATETTVSTAAPESA